MQRDAHRDGEGGRTRDQSNRENKWGEMGREPMEREKSS